MHCRFVTADVFTIEHSPHPGVTKINDGQAQRPISG